MLSGAWAGMLKPVTNQTIESAKKKHGAFSSPADRKLSKCELLNQREEKKLETITKKKLREEERKVREEEAKQREEEREAKRAAKEAKALEPKAAQSAYFLFAADVRAGICAANPELKVTEVAKIIGEQWKALSEEDRAPYKTREGEDQERYERECEAAGIEPRRKKKRPVEASENEGEAKQPKQKKEKSETVPKKAVKPAMTPVQIYRAKHRDRVVAANPEAEVGAIIEILCKEFAELTEAEAAPYEAEALADSERYAAEMAEAQAAAKQAKAAKQAEKEAKQAEKEAKLAQKEAKKAQKEAKNAKATKKGSAKGQKAAGGGGATVERQPEAWEAEVLDALAEMKKAGVDAEKTLHGWVLKVKLRKGKEGDEGKARVCDLFVQPPKSNKKLASLLAIKRQMGIIKEVAPEAAGASGSEEAAATDVEMREAPEAGSPEDEKDSSEGEAADGEASGGEGEAAGEQEDEEEDEVEEDEDENAKEGEEEEDE